MTRGIYSILADEVRMKLLHRPHGSPALQGVWTALDRWLVNATFVPNTLLLGVESDRETKKKLKTVMRGDYRITVVAGGIFQERVDELVDFDLPVAEIASGPDFGVFWTMAVGFAPAFKDRVLDGLSLDRSLSNCLHDGDIMRDHGPTVVIYRNFLDDETCVRIRVELWESLMRGISNEFSVPLLERSHVSFDGETYDLSSTVRIYKDPLR